jgi:pimeloyl-ACP methyl ester carboxylesterase
MKLGHALFFLALLLLAGGCSQADSPALEPTLELAPCRLDGGRDARCGTLPVFEDRAAGAGRTIDLAIAVVPATGSEPEADPLFLLAGGPGQAAIEAFGPVVGLFSDILEKRDIVLVDQRGAGQSNPLACENLEDESLPADLPDAEVVTLMDDCRQTLEQDADLALYTTELAMQDLDDVRAALGYEQINLYGASYGTRAALEYMRRFPDRARTAVLDAVAGPELILFDQMPVDGQRALDLLFERCAAEDDCRTAFPNLRDEYEALLDRLATPEPITVAHPLTNEPIELTLTRERLSQYVFSILYSAEFQSLLPLLIHQAHETGDFTPLVVQAVAVNEGAGLYPGLLYAVACSEDVPLIDLAASGARQEATDFAPFADRAAAICDSWPQATIAPDFRDPLSSDIPVLLLSGDADPVTPPAYAAQVAETLPNSRHLILPGWGHGVITAGCMPSVVARFISSGDTADLDTGCLDELQPPPFFTSFTGPEP